MFIESELSDFFKGGDLYMNILQEYEDIEKVIGYRKFGVIEKYIDEKCPKEKMNNYEQELAKINGSNFYDWLDKREKLAKKHGVIFFSDVIYNRNEWENFEKWYNDRNKNIEIKILNTWTVDYDNMKCNAIIKKNGNEVANIITDYETTDIREAFGYYNDRELDDEFIKSAFEELIFCDLDSFLNLPKVSECSKLLQSIYDDVSTSDVSMCHITNDEWEEYYADEYTDEDIENLELEIKKFGLDYVLETNDGEYKIVGYYNLDTMFNDDRNLNKDKNKEMVMC